MANDRSLEIYVRSLNNKPRTTTVVHFFWHECIR